MAGWDPQVKGCMWGLAPAAAAPQPGRAGSRVGTCRGLDLAAPIRQPLNHLEVTGCDYYPGGRIYRGRGIGYENDVVIGSGRVRKRKKSVEAYRDEFGAILRCRPIRNSPGAEAR